MTAKTISIPENPETLANDVRLLYGDAVLAAMLKIFGGGARDVLDVPFDVATDCFARLERLVDPSLPPLPPHGPAPVVARNQTEARLFKLEFKEQARARKEKAAALGRMLVNRCDTPALSDKIMGVASVAYSNGDVIGIRSDKARELCAMWGIRDYVASGLIVATVGSLDRPCVRGLAGLEAILKTVPTIAGPHAELLTDRPPTDEEAEAILEPIEAEHDAAVARIESAFEREDDKADADCDREREEASAAHDRERETLQANREARQKEIDATYERESGADQDERAARAKYLAALEANESDFDTAWKACNARFRAADKAALTKLEQRRAAATAKRTRALAGERSRFLAIRNEVRATGKMPEPEFG